MIIISNSSPLIALSRIDQLSILKYIFGKIYIPNEVYQETVIESTVKIQQENILKAIDDFIIVAKPQTVYLFRRTLDLGEKGVINLALDKQANFLIIDDKKARNEAKEIGFKVLKTSTLLKKAETLKLITSYSYIKQQLADINIYLP